MPRPLFTDQAFSAQSALNVSKVYANDLGNMSEGFLVSVVFGPGTSVGAVIIEGAPTPNFTGDWAPLATITWAAANRAHETFVAGSFFARRIRISTAIVGGTVDAWVQITG